MHRDAGPATAIPTGDLSATERAKIAQLIMGDLVGTMAMAGVPQTAVGARFVIELGGELSGRWLLDLVPETIGVRPLREADVETHGRVRWQLSAEDTQALVAGRYRFVAAWERGDLRLEATPPAMLAFSRFIVALASADPVAALSNPAAYLTARLAHTAAPSVHSTTDEDLAVQVMDGE